MVEKKKKTKRALQAEETRKKIFNSTMDLIEKKGFENITIQDIIEFTGVSVGTFYHYYKTKEDVFFELYRKADEYFEEVVTPLLYTEEISSGERVLLFFRNYAEYNMKNGIEYVTQLYNTKNKFFISRDRYMLDLLNQIVIEGQNSGEFRSDIDSEDIIDDLFIVSRGIIFDWCLHNGSYELCHKMHTHLKRHIEVFSIS